MTKAKTKRQKEHLKKTSELGCLICLMQCNPFVPCELHHIRDMTGMGTRSSDFEVIPLCVNHHRIGPESFHENSKGFSKKWGSQKELLQRTLKLLEDGGYHGQDIDS